MNVENIYSGSATFGKGMSIAGFVMTTLIVILFLVTGGYMVSKKLEFIIPKKVKLSQPFSGQERIEVTSSDNCKSILTGFTTDSVPVCFKGSKYNEKKQVVCADGTPVPEFTVYADKETCSEFVHLSSDKSIRNVGGFLIGFSLFVLIASSIHLYLVMKYKPYAAYEGMSTGLNILTGTTRSLTSDIMGKL